MKGSSSHVNVDLVGGRNLQFAPFSVSVVTSNVVIGIQVTE
jgi:hypothetical protein